MIAAHQPIHGEGPGWSVGRLTLAASYVASCVRTLCARLVDNHDLELAERITADGGFRWIFDRTRVPSHHPVSEELHRPIVD